MKSLADIEGARPYLVGNTLDRTADAMAYAALGWLAAQGSPVDAALVLGLGAVPRVAMLSIGGVLADRLGLGQTAQWTLGARLIALGGLAVALADGSAGVLALACVAVALGIIDGIHIPAMVGLGGLIGQGPRMASLQGALNMWGEAGEVLAPVLAGWLLVGATVWLVPAMLVPSLIALAMIQAIAHLGNHVPETEEPAVGVWQAWREGVRAAAGLGPILAFACLVNALTTGPILGGAPMLAAANDWGGSEYGLVVAAFSVGLGVGAAALARWGDGVKRPQPVAVGLVIPGALVLGGFGFAHQWWAAAVIVLVCGAVFSPSIGLLMALIKTRTDPALMGRVMSLVQLGMLAGVPVSYAVLGSLVAGRGLSFAIASMSAALVIIAVSLLFSTRLGARRVRV